MSLAIGTRLGPYEIAAAIGAGGMGEVYRANDTRLDRYVAIKVIHSDLPCTPELINRFEREARVLSSLSHPHICALHDIGTNGHLEFLVMELLDGETLSARLRKGPLPVSAVVRLGMEIADALAAAHRLGVMHRDLKPSNIMLTANGAKLMDFGLAKPSIASRGTGSAGRFADLMTATIQHPSTPLSTAGTLIGTVQYMAPEQIEGREADVRSDIFALGSVLYEAVSGRAAFQGKTHLSVASAILQKDPPPIIIENPEVGLPPLEYAIRNCMAKEPDERFQNAQDVKLQLGWLSSHSALPQTPRRKRETTIAFIAMAAMILTLLSTLVIRELKNRPAAGSYGLTRFSIALPPQQELAVNNTQAVVISPDGKTLAYVTADKGVSHLYTRRLDQFESVAIPDSEGTTFPFFSPK